MSYSEKLKDPRWQRKRLEIMQSAGFKCEFCGDETSTLHIHHLKYTGEPWEAPSEDLECLCETHHQMRETEGAIVIRYRFSDYRASVARDFDKAIKSARRERGVSLARIIEAINQIEP